MPVETSVELVNSGAISFLPTLLVLIMAVLIRRPIEALFSGVVVGIFILHGSKTISALSETAIRTMQDEDLIWIILVCGGMGALIGLFLRTGSLYAFMDKVSNHVETRFGAILATWFMGILLFVDDYLNSITVGAAMSHITDKFKISREMLAYIVDSTAAPVSVIIPISTWAVFFGTILENVNLATEGEGLSVYISAIPYMLYPWIAVFMVPLVASGKIPLIGPMKKAEHRAIVDGQPLPIGGEHIHGAKQAIVERKGVKRTGWLFSLPLIGLVGFTLYFDMEFLHATLATLALTTSIILTFRVLDMHDTFDTLLNGFKTMIDPLLTIICAFMLKDVNDQLGLTNYILEISKVYMTAETLPFIVFFIMGLIAFATGSSWGVFVIALPIISELTASTGANVSLVIGATLSASTFGSHACLYADATVLTAQSCGTSTIQHAFTQLPYAIMAAILTLIGFALIT